MINTINNFRSFIRCRFTMGHAVALAAIVAIVAALILQNGYYLELTNGNYNLIDMLLS